MSEDPGHKAMLYFLEVLMNSNGPLTISQLAGRFGSRSFTSEMRVAAGGNESGLKKFFLKYPSLFTVNGNMVSLFDSSKAPEQTNNNGDIGGGITPSGRSLPDVSTEMEAVQFFRNKLLKKEESWIPSKSLAGHLSQASHEIRQCVGPQLEFRNWLLKHPHIFEVQGDLVGLRDSLDAVTAPTPTFSRRIFDNDNNNEDKEIKVPKTYAPKSPSLVRKIPPPKSPAALRRSHSFSERRMSEQIDQVYDTSPICPIATPVTKRRSTPVTMTANEYKAVMHLKDLVEKNGLIQKQDIIGFFSQTQEGVKNTIGHSITELDDFLARNTNVFQVEDEKVTIVKNAKLNVIITGSRSYGQNIRTLNGRKGRIYHVAKLWGIIDLGKHEHVFFDKSIMRRPIDDLQKHYKVGEILYFNAVLALKTSRAKWRAIHVWKENESEPGSADFDLSPRGEGAASPSTSIEDEINRFLPQYDDDKIDSNRLSVGSVSGWNPNDMDSTTLADHFSLYQNDLQLKALARQLTQTSTVKIEPEKPQVIDTKSLPTSITRSSNGPMLVPKNYASTQNGKMYVNQGCQTVSTGEIIATQLYQEET